MMGITVNHWTSMSDSAILVAIGKYLKSQRLGLNKTQAQIATEAGINRWTVSQIEHGESITLASLIQILRVLDLLPLLDIFTIDETISPIEYAKLQEKKRLRARPKSQRTGDNEEIGW